MKRFILTAALLSLVSLSASAAVFTISSDTYINDGNEQNLTMETLWNKNGKYEEKVIDIGSKLLYDNGINKRVPFWVGRDKTINADSSKFNKIVTVHQGIFPYIDNDDEMAFIIGHEISHSLDAYGGFPTWTAENFNSKHYEAKADLMSIDMMVKSGYNPIAAITCINKWMPEAQWDFGLFVSHPKSTKRLIAIYKYIKVKYPQYLNSPMTSNIHYVNFKRVMDRDIRDFDQKKLERDQKRLQKTNANEKV